MIDTITIIAIFTAILFSVFGFARKSAANPVYGHDKTDWLRKSTGCDGLWGYIGKVSPYVKSLNVVTKWRVGIGVTLLSSVSIPGNAETPTLVVSQASQMPQIDGSLADAAWKQAAQIGELTLTPGPAGTGLTALPTEVRVLWDTKNLYVRFVCRDDDITVPEHGHDAALYKGDVAEVFLDPVGDGRELIELEVSPDNDVMDIVHLLTTEAKSGPDGILNDDIIRSNSWDFLSWDLPGLKTATGKIQEYGKVIGWTADFAIPAKDLLHRLELKEYKPMSIRANFMRYDQQKSAATSETRRMVSMNWSPVIWGRPHRSPAAMGTLQLVNK